MAALLLAQNALNGMGELISSVLSLLCNLHANIVSVNSAVKST